MSKRLRGGRWCADLQVSEAPALAQAGEVAHELHGVRLANRGCRLDHSGGGWCGFLARALAGSHLNGADGETFFFKSKDFKCYVRVLDYRKKRII